VNVRFAPGARLQGRIAPPADKSISHRAAIVGAMASEPVRITNFLDSADTRSTLEAVRELGAIVQVDEQEVVIRGCGLRNAQAPGSPIDVGNAGTLMRLLPGWRSSPAPASSSTAMSRFGAGRSIGSPSR
jgi:3-phosphoshikimate 1-carboxyvinyltransferase